jgi:uncharacterized protein (DUF4415 family)
VRIDWDPAKAEANLREHGVSFSEAATVLRGCNMKKVVAEPYRRIDFSRGKRGPVIESEPGKTKISIRLDNRIIDHFRSIVESAGGGNYQTLINDALVAYIQQRSVLEAIRQVIREEIAGERVQRGLADASTRSARKRGLVAAG